MLVGKSRTDTACTMHRSVHSHCALFAHSQAEITGECLYNVHLIYISHRWVHPQCTLHVHSALVSSLIVYTAHAMYFKHTPYVLSDCCLDILYTADLKCAACERGAYLECTMHGTRDPALHWCSKNLRLTTFFGTSMQSWHISVHVNGWLKQFSGAETCHCSHL